MTLKDHVEPLPISGPEFDTQYSKHIKNNKLMLFTLSFNKFKP